MGGSHGTMKVPSQRPNLLSMDAAVSFCPLLPNPVMVRSGSDPRNFYAVMIAPLLASLSHMYSMYEKSGADRFS